MMEFHAEIEMQGITQVNLVSALAASVNFVNRQFVNFRACS